MRVQKRSWHQSSLEEVKQLFSEWRKRRKPRTPIPAYLWERAVKLSKEYSVNQISQALHLNHTALKKRFQQSCPDRTLSTPSMPAFVELTAPAGRSCLCNVIEMESPRGFKMRIEIQGESSPLLLELSRRFMGQRS